MKRRKENLILESIEVSDLASEGKAIAKIDKMVLFITGAIPGDVVDVRVIRKKKNFMEGIIERMVRKSPDRLAPVCEHFGICGGCTWQQLPYEKQLFYKEKQVKDHIQRIGRITNVSVNSILPSPKVFYYRNKLEYTFSHRRWFTKEEVGSGIPFDAAPGLGFHIPGKFDKVLDINNCHLQPEPSNEIRLAVRKYALDHKLEFFDIVRQTGFLRNMIIRNNLAGEFMVILSFFYEDRTLRQGLLKFLKETFPQIISLQYTINPKGNDTINDLDVNVHSGQDHLMEQMEDLQFRISPKSFFQTNVIQAQQLYSLTREMAALKGEEIVYDLYTGTGTIALFLARYCRKVVAIEYVQEAIDDAQINAEINEINNVSFFAGDIKMILTRDFIQREGKPQVIILDPPRAGVQEEVLKGIMEAGAERLVYVSCNPATQARDIQILSDGYEVKRIQPVDMFPHTMHVENVALLEKKRSHP